MQTIKTQVLVVGAGPGGYVAAIRCGQLGLQTTIVEAERNGGTCLIKGCIPSKALIHAASKFEDMNRHATKDHLGISLSAPAELDFTKTIAWKDDIVNKLSKGVGALLKKNKVEQMFGWANFTNAKTCVVSNSDGESTKIEAEHVILANGSQEVRLDFLGDSNNIISSTDALDLTDVPKKMTVIGAGYIGLELGIAYAKLGTEVTFVEAADSILPQYDQELTKPVMTWLKRHKVKLHLSSKAKAVTDTEEGSELLFEDAEGNELTVVADKVLVTVGRKPNTVGWGLENMCLDMAGRFIKIDDYCQTAMRNVWAIGDITGEPMLAHKASAQGEIVAENIASSATGKKVPFNPTAIAAVCFTEPEVVSVGLSPDDAEAAGYDITIGKFPFAAIGKAMTQEAGKDGGFVRIVARKENHHIIGIQAVGAHVAELSNQFALAIEMGACLEDFAGTIHVHPTLGEASMEAALAGLGHAIHI